MKQVPRGEIHAAPIEYRVCSDVVPEHAVSTWWLYNHGVRRRRAGHCSYGGGVSRTPIEKSQKRDPKLVVTDVRDAPDLGTELGQVVSGVGHAAPGSHRQRADRHEAARRHFDGRREPGDEIHAEVPGDNCLEHDVASAIENS